MPNQTERILAQAAGLDAKAEDEGIDAIAPLYGLLVPAKGTMATTDFPSSAGTGLLHYLKAKVSCRRPLWAYEKTIYHGRKFLGVSVEKMKNKNSYLA